MVDDNEFVPLTSLHDAVDAQVLVGLLAAHGITAATPGLHHRAMLGVVGSYVEIAVSVPKAQLTEAREVLTAYQTQQRLDAKTELSPSPTTSPKQRVSTATAAPRKGRIAAFCALCVTFGCGHFYAGDRLRGVVLLVSELAAFGYIVAGDSLVGVALPAIVLADLLGSSAAVRHHNGQRANAFLRLLPLLAPLFVIAAPASTAIAPAVLLTSAARRACDLETRCGGIHTECVQRLANATLEWSIDHEKLDECVRCAASLPCPA